MRWLGILGVLTIAGCGTAETSLDAPTRAIEAGPDSCGAATHEGLIGQPLQNLDQSLITDPVRIVPPGSIVTTDYSPRRLNVDLDGREDIVRFWCG